MISDGVDNYERQFDPNDPYVQAAINDSVRSGLIVYSMYWQNMGRANSSETQPTQARVCCKCTQATGGNSYWQGPETLFRSDHIRRPSAPTESPIRSQLRDAFNGKPEVKS